MAASDLRYYEGPLGPLRDKFSITLGTDGYENENGFICQVADPGTGASAGKILYDTLEGSTQQQEDGLAAGDTINACGIPVLLRRVYGSSGGSVVVSVVVGIV